MNLSNECVVLEVSGGEVLEVVFDILTPAGSPSPALPFLTPTSDSVY